MVQKRVVTYKGDTLFPSKILLYYGVCLVWSQVLPKMNVGSCCLIVMPMGRLMLERGVCLGMTWPVSKAQVKEICISLGSPEKEDQ